MVCPTSTYICRSYQDIVDNPDNWFFNTKDKLASLLKAGYPDCTHKGKNYDAVWFNTFHAHAPSGITMAQLDAIAKDRPGIATWHSMQWKDLQDNPDQWECLIEVKKAQANNTLPDFRHLTKEELTSGNTVRRIGLWLNTAFTPQWAKEMAASGKITVVMAPITHIPPPRMM